MHLLGFSSHRIVYLALCVIFLVIASFFHEKRNYKLSVVSLLLGSFAVGVFAAVLDPYLNIWDEGFHALVAKNMMNNPFKPMLYHNPLLPYDFTVWSDNHIWLHKQPLFLWQMALSMKIFGVNEFAVRLPDIIMHAILPYFILRIGKITVNRNVGFYAALLFAVAYYPLELIAGKFSTDHNDFAFLFYVTASFWAWFEYMRSGEKKWLIFIGVFSGMAVLVKWLMGLLVFVLWAFTFFSKPKELLKLKSYFPPLISFIISLVIFIPWQLYILTRFPVESRFEFSAFSSHFSNAVEGHRGDFWFHFNATKLIYGDGLFFSILLIMAFIALLLFIKKRKYRVFIPGAIIFVYLFYSLAETKMLSFTLIVAPFLFIGFSLLISKLIELMSRFIKKKFLVILFQSILILALSVVLFNIKGLQINHTEVYKEYSHYRQVKKKERKFVSELATKYDDKNTVVFNTLFIDAGHIPFMFYADFIAYKILPNEIQIDDLTQKGYDVVILDFGDIPEKFRRIESVYIEPVN